MATISGNVLTIVGAGTAVISASQAGNTNYSAAAPVSQTLTVNIGGVPPVVLDLDGDGTEDVATANALPGDITVLRGNADGTFGAFGWESRIEAGLAPRDAAVRAMHEVSGPIVAIGLVLTAVFVPLAFVSGLEGQFYRQFAVTISVVAASAASQAMRFMICSTRCRMRYRARCRR